MRKLDQLLATFAASRFSLALLFIFVLGFSGLLAAFLPLPLPWVHDEFSYLLQADTFAHGRLANPTHPLWPFFETFHVIQQPVYASKYPPASGAMLALGQILWKPILGVWIGIAAAVTAVFWMLRAVVPARWALAGALLTYFNPQVLHWNWNYWGGAIALLGGALLFGGFVRLVNRSFTRSAALWSGCGMMILSLSRPFEGVIVSLLVVAILGGIWIRQRRLGEFVRACLFMAIPVSAGLLFVFAYNVQTTGHLLTMPYVIYEKTYSSTPLFFWEKMGPVRQYTHLIFERFYTEQRAYFQKHQDWMGYLRALNQKASTYQSFTWNGLVIVCLVSAFHALKRDRFVLISLLLLGSFLLITLAVSTYALPHYAAPVVPLFILAVVLLLRHLAVWKRKEGRAGFCISRIVVVLFCCAGLFWFFGDKRKIGNGWEFQRADIVERLSQTEGQHLIVVRYRSDHRPDYEWVYNGADIDGSRIVWARDMGESKNKELLHYFKNRQHWLIEPDRKGGTKLRPYSGDHL